MNRHALLMLACCLIPLALVGVVVTSGANLGGILPFAIMLLCPLAHILMMRGMGHDHSGHHAEGQAQDTVAPDCHGDGRSATAQTTISRR